MRKIHSNNFLVLTFSAIFLAGGIHYAAAVPTNSSLPSIAGEATVGTSLTVNTGSWSSAQITFNIQWFSCTSNLSSSCVAQSGRTTGTYLITASDLTKYIRASVTALDSTGGATVFTGLVGPVVTPPQVTALPVITGVATPVITGKAVTCGGVTTGPTNPVKTVAPPVESKAVTEALIYLVKSDAVIKYVPVVLPD